MAGDGEKTTGWLIQSVIRVIGITEAQALVFAQRVRLKGAKKPLRSASAWDLPARASGSGCYTSAGLLLPHDPFEQCRIDGLNAALGLDQLRSQFPPLAFGRLVIADLGLEGRSQDLSIYRRQR